MKKILNFFFRLLLVFCDSLLLHFPRKINPSSLLLIRLDRIGDFVLWLDTAQSYRKLYPGHHVVLIVNSIVSDLASEFDCWDEVWPLNTRKFKHNLLYRWSIMFRVHQTGFNTAIQPTYSRELMCGDSLIRASCAVHRIGSSGDLSNIRLVEKNLSDKWYTQLIQANNQMLMEFDRNIEFLSGIGFTFSSGVNSKLSLIDNDLSRLNLPPKYYIIFPGASSLSKMWPPERFAQVATFLSNKTGWPMVICGTKNESSITSKVISLSKVETYDLTGKTSLQEFINVVKFANILVSNDTSAVHIAACVRTKSVCIISGKLFGRFLPYSSNVPWLSPVPIYADKLTSITVQAVEDVLLDMIL